MKITKQHLIDNIYKKLGGAVSKLIIRDVITVISNYIQEEVKQDRSVSIQNFGTFSPFNFHERGGLDVYSGKPLRMKNFKSVKFSPHAVFRSLLEGKRKKFETKEQ